MRLNDSEYVKNDSSRIGKDCLCPAVTRTAKYEDIPRLKELWQSCFGDEPGYIDLFFDDLFSPDDYILLEVPVGNENTPINADNYKRGANDDMLILSSCILLPCTLVTGSKTHRISYLYALCTDPAFQKHGFGRSLLHFAHSYCKSRGDAGIALVPAEDWLFSFYEAEDYKKAFNGKKQTENHICYTKDVLTHLKHTENYFGETIPDEHSLVGLFRRLDDTVGDFGTAYMAYPMN
ncbi:MAG: GNAT family N-acetyltransferase [Clostridia bacterium]|nr:GNAT family N-acetyltransferase [Clostridia bacterium]